MSTSRASQTPSHPTSRRGLGAAGQTAYALIAAATLFLTWLLSRFTIDDSFITWRYGDNLIRHGVWNWNPSATDKVEAYTNPTYAALSIIPPAIGLSAEFFFKLVSLALLVTLVVWIMRLPGLHWAHRAVLLLLTAANPTFHVHLWSGLETPMYVVFLTLVFGSLYVHGGLGRTGYVLALLIALTRPEGIGFAVLAVLWALLIRPSRGRLTGAIAVIGAICAYWAARAAYFGAFFPNTFYIKTVHAGGSDRLGALIRVVLTAGAVAAALLVTAVLLDRWLGRSGLASGTDTAGEGRRGWWARIDRAALTPVVFAVASAGVILVLYRSSNLLMNYVNRFEWQLVLPVVLVALARPVAVRTLARQVPETVAAPVLWPAIALLGTAAVMMTNTGHVKGQVVRALLLLAVVLAVAVAARQRTSLLLLAGLSLVASAGFMTPESLLTMVNYRPRLDDAHGRLAKVLHDSREDHRVLTVGDAGVIPLESGWTTLDVYGLANRAVANGTFNDAYLEEKKPEIIVVTAGRPQKMPPKSHKVKGMALTSAYAQRNGYLFSPGARMRSSYYMQVYARPDIDPQTWAAIQQMAKDSSALNHMGNRDYFEGNLNNFPFLRHWRSGS
ncbi:MAG: hypothetical protein LWW86_00245 [Micrococcales bacterium]|nr:hypothetical protein [Micrococcales bacterium]